MALEPPTSLVDRLARLGLVTPAQLQNVATRVHRLTRDLPAFESVWVDALAGARLLTPLQASEINAGREDRLIVGPYVLSKRLASLGYASVFLAHTRSTGAPVRLALCEPTQAGATEALRQLETLADQASRWSMPGLLPIFAAGEDAGRLWATCSAPEGISARTWLVENGRMPPDVVWEIARQMAACLAKLEELGGLHGDACASNLLLTADGHAHLSHPGLRPIVRTEEGYAHADLPPEAFDYLAPERVAEGTPPSAASDVLACGYLWWELLTGRGVLRGGDSLARLRAAHAAKTVDVRRFAPETPPALAEAIARCMRADPSARPTSFARLAAELGPPTKAGQAALARTLSLRRAAYVQRVYAVRQLRSSRPARMWLTTAAAGAAVLAAATWPIWSAHWKSNPTPALASQRAAEPSSTGKANRRPVSTEPHLLPTVAAPPLTPRTESQAYQAGYAESVGVPPLRLPIDAPATLDTTKLQAGQLVEAAEGGRATIVVPTDGLRIAVEDVRFRNIDFVWRDNAARRDNGQAQPTIVELAATRATFDSCSFQSDTERHGGLPAAIRWSGQAASGATSLPPSGQVRITACVFRGVSAAVWIRSSGASLVEVDQSLHLGPGPAVMIDRQSSHAPATAAWLSRVTVRDARSVVECRYQTVDDQPSEIAIGATQCVFSPSSDGSLIAFDGPEPPGRLLKAIAWNGEGSLLAGSERVALWRRLGQDGQPLPEDALSIAGVVLSRVQFAGDDARDPAASRALRWQAPLQSDQPPGIGQTPLALPTLR